MRIWYKGITLPCHGRNEGSIPFIRYQAQVSQLAEELVLETSCWWFDSTPGYFPDN